MIVRKFLAWTQKASAADRASGASALARAYLQGDLTAEDRCDAEIALTALLDDPAPSVRRAMSHALADSPDAPAHMISALACDQSDISVPVLSRSPLLSNEDLAECAGIADTYGQSAIALRPNLSAQIADVIATVGGREALISLAVNETADLGTPAMQMMLERFGEDGEVREALLGRHALPPLIRAELIDRTGMALQAFVTGCGWMSNERATRTVREARDKGVIEVAATDTGVPGARDPRPLLARLREKNQLTAALLLRALLSGDRSVFEAALCELTGLGDSKVRGLVRAWSGAGFGAVYSRAGLPAALLPAFRAALAAQDDTGLIYEPDQRPRLSRQLVDAALRTCRTSASPELGRVIAHLQRLRAEAARDEARTLASELIAEMKKPVIPSVEAPAEDRPLIEIDLEAIEAEIRAAA